MKWSIQELFRGMRVVSNKGFRLRYKLLHWPSSLWRQMSVLFEWLVTGYSYTTNWSLDTNMVEIMRNRIIQFKKSPRIGIPGNLQIEYPELDMDAAVLKWEEILDEMIEGLDAYLGLDNISLNHDVPFEVILKSKLNPEEQDKLNKSYEKYNETHKALVDKFKRAMDLIKTYISGLWD